MQIPFDPKDWSSIPQWLVAFGFLIGIGVWAAKQLGLVKKQEPKPALNVDIIKTHETFADDPQKYWRDFREANEPMTRVLVEMASVLKELRDLAIREEGRKEAERERVR